ncbi:DUF7619 domain-containing protein [Flavobacterium suncheonense]|uniref:DUF7619 domain-containing protein n=1 Tax=Flavobacterium suncheonense TaxID=350894 RepID=UPI003FA34A81
MKKNYYMKKIYLLFLLLTGMVQAQIVNIPDANFKARLLSASPTVHVGSTVNPNSSATYGIYTTIDTNGDGEIQVSEAEAIIFLNLNSSATATNKIANLQGIEAFVNLQQLYCRYNNLTTVNLNGLSNLNFIAFDDNQLTSISTVGCSALKTFAAANNFLTIVDFSSTPLMQSIVLTNNDLTSLDLNGLQDIWTVQAGKNNLTTFSLSNKNALTTLYLGYNALTDVALQNLPHLYKINVQNNQLTSLDLSSIAYEPYLNNIPNASTLEISCNNNPDLISINMKNGFPNPDVDFFSPSLADLVQYICTDEGDVFTFSGYNTGSMISQYCNFTPGGNFNTITGNVLFDGDNNGCDASDAPQPFIKVKINDGTTEGASFVNNSGNYFFYTDAGTFTVTPDLENSAFFNVSPANAVINFPDNNNNVATQHFCLSANGVHPDLEIVVAPVIPARPGFDAVYKIVYKNKGNQTLSQAYGISFSYNQNLMNLVSTSELTASQTPGTLTWSYANLMPFESRSIEVVLHINTPVDANPVNQGDVLQFTTTILPMLGDETVTDNTYQYNQAVVNSFDPNDKICLEGEIEVPSKIGEYLHYIINFENIGAADAVNIVVKDVIDVTKFDEKTLQILDSSHPVQAKINGNIAEFIFEGINLQHGGHGNILLKIKTRDNLTVGDVVTNKADIFFDYNSPIATNVASTTFQLLGTNDSQVLSDIAMYPNPTNGIITVKSESVIRSVQLLDVQGRILQTKNSGERSEVLDLTSEASGVYFIKVTTDSGVKTGRLLRK